MASQNFEQIKIGENQKRENIELYEPDNRIKKK